ncbi:sensor histidine kinase [Altibacter lentus]|uniref:sensor histidine kinase n=2 Tax=Altibacter TaxID=1535231 RepID=UPI00068A1889|nr:ATP-binding protein [Altibacter lentus]
MHRKHAKKIVKSIYLNLLTLLGIIVLLGVILVMSYQSQNWLLRVSEVRNKILETHAAIKDAESKNKTFLITGEKVNKERYKAADLFATVKIKDLIESASLNNRQKKNAYQLDSLFRLKQEEMERLLLLFESGNQEEAVAIVTSPSRLQLKSDIAYQVDNMLDLNEEMFAGRNQNFNLYYYATIILVLLGIGYMVYGLSRIKGQLIPIVGRLNKANEILNKEIDLKNTEIELRQKQMAINEQLIEQLQEKNKELNQFAYIASHDLQEPLRTVDNFVTIFEEDYAQKLDEEAHTYFEFIKGATTRMRNLINGLLQYSRIGRSGEIETVDLNIILENIKKDFSQRFEESGAVIHSEALPTLQGYRIELKQLFSNLIGNSLKFVPEDRKPVIHIEVYESKNNYQITIRDNGIGIPRKYLTKIFDMFTRLHSETVYSGQGIGLAFCKKITELHGGIISVDSKEGEGTSFMVILKKDLTS